MPSSKPNSAKPSPRAIARKATSKKNTSSGGGYTLGRQASMEFEDLTLPSGATCQARRPGVQGLISAGILDNFDSLTALVQTEHVEKKSARAKQVTKDEALEAGMNLVKNPDKMAAGFEMIDKLTAHVIVQPPVWIDYQMLNESDESWADRQEEQVEVQAIGTHQIELEDKMFLMQWSIGGSADLAAFREGLPEGMGGLAAIQSLSR